MVNKAMDMVDPKKAREEEEAAAKRARESERLREMDETPMDQVYADLLTSQLALTARAQHDRAMLFAAEEQAQPLNLLGQDLSADVAERMLSPMQREQLQEQRDQQRLDQERAQRAAEPDFGL